MGVTQLWQVLAPVERHQSLASLEGLTLAVDLSIWVCETQCVKQMQGIVSKPFLRNLFFRISHLTQLGVKLVFIIEGTAPQLKWEVMMQRQQTRYPGRQGKQLSRAPVGKQTRRNFNACLKECCELLDILGIPYIQSRGEAEAMCALLNASGLVDGCLTNDGDAFLYGARTVYRNFTMNTKDPHVEMYTMCEIETQLEIDRQGLVALGLLLGCDFVPKGVPGIGVANATKLLQTLKGMDIMKRLQEWRTLPESRCVNQAEILARRKALSIPDFPQIKVIQEFMKAKDRCPTSISPWKRPVLAKFQDFALVKMEWPVEYTLEKVLPLITLWDMQDLLNSSNPSIHQHLKPHRIVKTRVRQGIACYEVEWYKPVTETSHDGDFYVTIETQEMFVKCFPRIVKNLESETAEACKKKKKNQGKRKKKNGGKTAKTIDDALDNLSFDLGKLDLSAVTAQFQQSAKSLPQWLPEDEGQQSMLLTKLKSQKHYSGGHAIAVCSNSCGDMSVSVPSASAITGHSTPGSVFSVNSPDLMKTTSHSNVVNKKTQESDEENVLPFLERVKLRMKAKSQSAVNHEIKTQAETGSEKSSRKKKRKKKGTKSEGHDISSSDISESGKCVMSKSQNVGQSFSDTGNHGQSSAADSGDMNSLLEDIENLSLLKESVRRQRNGSTPTGMVCNSSATADHGVHQIGQDVGQNKLKHRLSFSSTSLKTNGSPVTPFPASLGSVNAANLRKMSSPSCESVCSPMSYIQHSGQLTDSFEIRDSPGNKEKNLNSSKKKSKKAKKASQLAQTSANCSQLATGSGKKQTKKHKVDKQSNVMSDTKVSPQCETSPANLSGLDVSALKDFGDFSVQHSLLNSLCASLVQAITPKGISQEEYENLCAALNKLEGKDEHSSSAQEWIESEIDKSLDKVSLADVQAVSNNIHNSFNKAAGLKSVNLSNTSMQSLHNQNPILDIKLDSEDYKNLSKSARKKLRRKERLKLLNNIENSPELPNRNPLSGVRMGSEQRNGSTNLQQSKTQNNSTSSRTNIKHQTTTPSGKYSDTQTAGVKVSEVLHVKPNNSKCKVSETGFFAGQLRHVTNDTSVKVNTTCDMRDGVKDCISSMRSPNSESIHQNGDDNGADEDSSEIKKKKKKRKKKKVKKAQAITNLSADESMLGDLQSMICSDYLKKAVQNLKNKSKTSGQKIQKASPVMDFSADETLLELDDLSCNLGGVGTSLDNKTRLKLARKRSSLDKMKQSTEHSPKPEDDKDVGSMNSVSRDTAPVLSLNKEFIGEINGEQEELPSTCEGTVSAQHSLNDNTNIELTINGMASPDSTQVNGNLTGSIGESIPNDNESGGNILEAEELVTDVVTETNHAGECEEDSIVSDSTVGHGDAGPEDKSNTCVASGGQYNQVGNNAALIPSRSSTDGIAKYVCINQEDLSAGDQEISHSANSAYDDQHDIAGGCSALEIELAESESDVQANQEEEEVISTEVKQAGEMLIDNSQPDIAVINGAVDLPDINVQVNQSEDSCVYNKYKVPVDNVTHNGSKSVENYSAASDEEFEIIVISDDDQPVESVQNGVHGTKAEGVPNGVHGTELESVQNGIHGTEVERVQNGIHGTEVERVQNGIHGTEVESVQNGIHGTEVESSFSGEEGANGVCEIIAKCSDISCLNPNQPGAVNMPVNGNCLKTSLDTDLADSSEGETYMGNPELDKKAVYYLCNEQHASGPDFKSICFDQLTCSTINGHSKNNLEEATEENVCCENDHYENMLGADLGSGQSITEHRTGLTNGHNV